MSRSADITSFSEHRQNLRRHLDRVKKTGRPLFITNHGKAEAVVMSAEAFDELADRADLQGTLEAIDRSEKDIAAGRVQSVRDAFKTLAKKHGLRIAR